MRVRRRLNIMSLQNTIIVVNEEPYCIWEVDLAKRNTEFIEGIDVDYFEYLLNVHLNAEDEKRASIALKTTLHHAVETFFSLLGAYIQAPDCVYAWVAKCSNKELRSLIKKIAENDPAIFKRLNIDQVSWESVAELIFQRYMPNTEKSEITKKLFAKFWGRLAHEFLDDNNINEYNSLKHGFRVRSGGFSLAVGVQPEKGAAPPREEIKSLGGSEHGTKFIKLEPLGETKNNRSLRSRKVSLNWRVEKVALQLQLVCTSITNIITALKIANGIEAGKCNFVRPTEDDDFEKPWSFSSGVISLSMDYVIDEAEVVQLTRQQLLEILDDNLSKK
jgi:hypothetical protein